MNPTSHWWNTALLMADGRNEIAVRAASLIDPGTHVWVAPSPQLPPGITQAVAARAVSADSAESADVIVAGWDALQGSDPPGASTPRDIVAVVANDLHGSRRHGGETTGRREDHTVELLTAWGYQPVAMRQRTFADYATTPDNSHLRSDPASFVDWFAVRATLGQPKPLRAQPATVPARSVIFLAQDPPANWAPEVRSSALAAMRGCRSDGSTPVLAWNRTRLSGSISAYPDWVRAGIVLHGGDGVFDLREAPGSVVSPSTTALLLAYRPVAVVCLEAARLDAELRVAISALPEVHVLALESASARDSEVVDVVCSTEELPQQLNEATSDRIGDRTPVIVGVERRSRTPGAASVVIPVHGGWQLTNACLTSLREHTRRPLEIIVVDNASPDETRAALRSHADVKVIELDRNAGFAGGTNRGLVAATGEFVCLLNNDTEVTQGWLDRLLAALDKPGTGIVGPRSNRISGLQIVPGAPPIQPNAHDWAARWSAARSGITWLTSRLVGFCMVLRGTTLEEVGGLDEGVGIGNFEDDDLGHRVRAHGLTLRVADDAVVLHHGSATFAEMGISYLQTMKAGARQAASRWPVGSDLATGVVVLGTETEREWRGAAETVSSLLPLADRVMVQTSGGTLGVALHCAPRAPRAATFVTSNDQGEIDVSSPWAIVARAGQTIAVTDWGRARAALESLDRRPWLMGDLGLVPASGRVALTVEPDWPTTALDVTG